MSEVVRVRELTKQFGDFTAVDHITFDVSQGEIFGFLGPNGAGKTTTIKMLTGLTAPTSGQARVAGFDVAVDAWDLKQKIGYMSQLFSLYADLTVEENISLFAGLYGVTGSRLRERREWILGMAGLQDYHTQLTGDLPLGWKQRLALGCAVLHEPPILFLDEPTSGVDPVARRSFWDLIDELSAAGTTVFVSTHYMEEAEYCHRLAFMNRGRLIALDTPAQLRHGMDEPILEFTTDDPPRAVELLAGEPGVHEASLYGRAVRVAVSNPDRARETIRRRLEAHDMHHDEIRVVPPRLEDAFVSHVRREGGAVIG